MRRALIFVALVLCSSNALAWECVAKIPPFTNALPAEIVGSAASVASSPAGENNSWWCIDKKAPAVAGKVQYKIEHLTVLKEFQKSIDPLLALKQAAAAATTADPLAAINALMLSGQTLPTAGTQKSYDYNTLRWMGCTVLATQPYVVPVDPLPANYCGEKPTLPQASPDLYRTPATGSLTLYNAPAEKLASIVFGKKAPPNAECACDIKSILGGGTVKYCPLRAGPTTEVTSCTLVKVP